MLWSIGVFDMMLVDPCGLYKVLINCIYIIFGFLYTLPNLIHWVGVALRREAHVYSVRCLQYVFFVVCCCFCHRGLRLLFRTLLRDCSGMTFVTLVDVFDVFLRQ